MILGSDEAILERQEQGYFETEEPVPTINEIELSKD
jgi:hypothetical protein